VAGLVQMVQYNQSFNQYNTGPRPIVIVAFFFKIWQI